MIRDINGDGRLDLAIGEKTADGIGSITIYINASRNPGNCANLHLRMDSPNPYAVGTLVEVWKAGALGTVGARPLRVERAHADATPIHVGLGQATHMDLRVTFPGKKALEMKTVAARENITLRPDGSQSAR